MYFKFIKTIAFYFLLCTISNISAQVVAQKVGNNPSIINSSAVLDVESVNKGFLPPRMRVIDRDAIVLPASGLIIYNTTSNALEVNTGTPLSPIWIVATNANLTGDVTSSGNVVKVGKINGIAMSSLASGLLKNTATTGVPSIAMVRTDYAEPTTALSTGILKNTTGTGVHTIAVATDFPVLNQNTTGNAATVTTNANLTGMVTSLGNVTTVVTNANLTGEATSVGNTVVLSNAAVIGKTLIGYVSGSGNLSSDDTVLQAIQKLDGNASVPSAVTVFTSNGTYTPAAGLKWITVECVGAGGAGGTAPATTTTTCATSGGGGGGGYRKVLITKTQLVGSSFAITVGLGGTVNVASGVGGTGGVSSFTSLVSANGGNGGLSTTASSNAVVASGGVGGSSLSSTGTLIFSLNGKNGEAGYGTVASATRFFKGGNGGDSFLGYGGINNVAIASNASSSTFTATNQYGGGGAGVALTGVRPLRQGQAGASGVVIVTEFF